MPRLTSKRPTPPDERHVLPCGTTITLRRSNRARRYSLRVPATGGAPVLTMPTAASPQEALRFARSRAGWLARQLQARPQEVRVAHGATLPLLGHPLTVVPGSGRHVVREGAALQVPGPAHRVGPRVAAWLKAEAATILESTATQHAARLGRQITKLDLRDTKGRWGSCSSAGRLMFSWRLVMAPEAVLDYVAAHEAAHLREMNHGPRFWALVEGLCPGHERHRAWLRHHGTALHRYDFTAQAPAAED